MSSDRRVLGVSLSKIFSVTLDGNRWIEVGENPEVKFGPGVLLVIESPEKNRPYVAEGSTVKLTLAVDRICGVCEVGFSGSVPPDA